MDLDTGSACHPELSQCIDRLREKLASLPKDVDGDPLRPMTQYFWTKYGELHSGMYSINEAVGPPLHVQCWVPCDGAYHKSEKAAKVAAVKCR
jgi:hypothetical protein